MSLIDKYSRFLEFGNFGNSPILEKIFPLPLRILLRMADRDEINLATLTCRAMAKLRNSHGVCPPEVLKFILDLFKYNDNTKNTFSDNYYRAALV